MRRSLDHPVRAFQQRLRHLQPELAGGLEIDAELEPGRLLDRKLRRFGALQNLVDVNGGAALQQPEIRPVTHQSAESGGVRESMNRWQPAPFRDVSKFLCISHEGDVRQDQNGLRIRLPDFLEHASVYS